MKRTYCATCPTGTFSDVGAKSIDECHFCPEGSITLFAGSNECVKCKAGTYEANRTSCVSCPFGTISVEGAKSKSECNQCPEGSMTLSAGADECTKCRAGTFELGRSKCQLCPAGFYSEIGAITCISCPEGFYNSYMGSAECKKCDPGSYEVNRTSCDLCPAGTFGVDSRCEACPNGTISDVGSSECTECPGGYISVNNGTRCRDEKEVREEEEEKKREQQGVTQSGNLALYAFGAVALIAIVFVIVFGRKNKRRRPTRSRESEKAIKISLVKKSNEQSVEEAL